MDTARTLLESPQGLPGAKASRYAFTTKWGVGVTSRSPSATYVPSNSFGRNPASLQLHDFHVTLFTRTNAAHGIVAVLARV